MCWRAIQPAHEDSMTSAKQRAKPKSVRLKDYLASAYLIDHVVMDVSLHATRTRVQSRLSIRPNPQVTRKNAPLVLNGIGLELESLTLDGEKLDPSAIDRSDVTLTLQELPARAFELESIVWINPTINKALMGLYRSKGVYCTQCEAEGFRRITFMLDRPDVMARYRVRLEGDVVEVPVLLANGDLVERGTLQGGRHYAIWEDPHPKPCYLFAMVGGDLGSIASSFTTASGRAVDLRIYVEHGKEARAAWAMDALKRSMAWDERAFGREYDLSQFNIVAVSDFNMGAMENKGLNVFNDRLVLASAETATDANFEAIESVIAHEYFHNWTGNRITCRDWFQLCLKEGLTVYRDQEFSSDERSRTVQRIADVRQLKATQFPEDGGPLAHAVRPETYVEINNFYTATIYEKGAELVRMIATLLGPEKFRAGMDLYFQRHDGHAATIEDFIACFAEISGEDFSQFQSWYSQPGTPDVSCEATYSATEKTLSLDFQQRSSKSGKYKPMVIPVRLGLLGSNGADLPLTAAAGTLLSGDVAILSKAQQTLRFRDVPERPVLSLLRGFSAPVKLTIDMSERDLAFLARHDSDLYNRWQALNQFAIAQMSAIYSALQSGKRSTKGITFARALGNALTDEALEPAYRAELLRLPSAVELAREIGSDIDPDMVMRAHRQLVRTVARTLEAELATLYKSSVRKGPYSPDAASTGLRSLRNGALSLLTARGEAADIKRLAAHYFDANNMTDQAHALMLLAHQNAPMRAKAFDHFHHRWQGDDLVIDVWFSAQAQSSLPDTLDRVKALCSHPLFRQTAPNKVRALLGVFAGASLTQFHRQDGAGYDFIADQVLVIDGFNPQVASRLLASFRSWTTLEPKRRALAKQTLERIAQTKKLSPDVREIIARMLE
jgi:aminopeptidase N